MAARPAVVGSVPTVVTYLEMTAPPPRRRCRRRAPTSRSASPASRRVSFYRYLYDDGRPRLDLGGAPAAVGRRSSREILADPAVEVNVLWLAGVPAGYAELDRRPAAGHRARLLRPAARVHRPRARPLAARLDDPPRLALAAPPAARRHLRSRPPARARRLPKRPAFGSMTGAASSSSCPRAWRRARRTGEGSDR